VPASLPPVVQETQPRPLAVLPIHDEASLDVDAVDFATGIPSEFTVEVLAEIMHSTLDLLGDEETTNLLSNLTFVGTSHAKKQSSYEARFFIVLQKHDKFKTLTEMMADPTIPSKQVRRFYVMLRGVMTPAKKMALNYGLLCYSQSLVKKEFIGRDLSDPKAFADAQCQPNTLETHFKVLFSVFKSEQIHCQLQKDFNGPGDFQACWKHAMAIAAEHRPLDCARKPNAAVADMSQMEKLRAFLEDGRLDPYGDYNHMMMVLPDLVLTTFILRGGEEVSETHRIAGALKFATLWC
jgi:hypothetical protein